MNEASSSVIMLILVVAIFYFMLMRPEKKRKKQAQEMRDNLKKGDVITTIGGIVGKIVLVNPDTIVIETSDDRVRMQLTKWAVSTVGVQTSTEVQPAKKTEKKDEETEMADESPAEEADQEEAPVAEEPASESTEDSNEEKKD